MNANSNSTGGWDSRVNDVFLQATEIVDDGAREAFLDEQCGDDAELLLKVRSMLDAKDEAADFFARPDGVLDAVASLASTSSGSLRAAEGTVIDRYKLLQRIGEGGFGVVYMAQQEEPVRREVALKVIKPGMDTREVTARFEAERQALAMMDHPNISKVLDGGTTQDKRPYFVMELVKGVPITEFCDKNNLNTKSRLRLFLQVCHAVQHAHHKGVIHRDLKPSNVMITLHDGNPVPKIIDFGIAKAISQRLTEKTLFTRYGQMIGTPQYMSPEQAEMSGLDIDTRSDVYSLGVLLYELLTGTTPLDAEQVRSAGYAVMVRLVQEAEPPVPSQRISSLGDGLAIVARRRGADAGSLRKTLNGDLDWIAMKALEKDRNLRYDTASGFADDIQRHLDDEPVVAGPPGAIYRLKKIARRNRALVFTAVTVALALIAGTAIATVGLIKALHERDKATIAKSDAMAAEIEVTRQRDLAIKAKNLLEETNTRLEERNEQIRHMLLHEAFAAATRPNRQRTEDLISKVQEAGGNESQKELVQGILERTDGDAAAALQHLKRAESLDPNSLAAKCQLLSVCTEQGEFKEFNRLKHDIFRMKPVTAEDYLFTGEAFIQFHPRRALEFIEPGRQMQDSPISQVIYAKALAKKGWLERDLDAIVTAREELVATQGLLGQSHRGMLEAMLPVLRMNIQVAREKQQQVDDTLLAYADECAEKLQTTKNPMAWVELTQYYWYFKDDLDGCERAWKRAVEYSSGDLFRTFYTAFLLRRYGIGPALDEFDRASKRSLFSKAKQAVLLALDGQAKAADMWEEIGDSDPEERRTAILVPILLRDTEGLMRARENWKDDSTQWRLNYVLEQAGEGDAKVGQQGWNYLVAMDAISVGDREKAMQCLQRFVGDEHRINIGYFWALGILAEMQRRPDWPKLPIATAPPSAPNR